MINGTGNLIEAGDYQIVWGELLNPQQLGTQKIVVAIDTTNGASSVVLPSTKEQKTNFCEFYIACVGGNDLTVTCSAGDTLQSPMVLKHGDCVCCMNLFQNHWISFVGYS